MDTLGLMLQLGGPTPGLRPINAAVIVEDHLGRYAMRREGALRGRDFDFGPCPFGTLGNRGALTGPAPSRAVDPMALILPHHLALASALYLGGSLRSGFGE